ncbi:MAG: hypothetical protein R6X02_03665 [Enhygromyxa sp.]
MSAPRFAQKSGTDLRLFRWIGRIFALLAMWPLWYAFFGKSRFDWEAMMFGGPGVLLGLALWGWAGYRLRHPREYLEIDRQAGVARLQRDEGEPVVCKLEALGEWSFTSFKTISSGSKGGRRVTQWHVARREGFGEHNLHVDLARSACEAWAARVDAAVRGSDELRRVTIGDLLAERFDAAITAGSGSLATIVLAAATGASAYGLIQLIGRTDGEALEGVVALAIVTALLVLGWRAARGPLLAAGIAGLIGAALISKPWIAPVTYAWDGAAQPLSPSAETHLYYVLPGIGLCVLALALLSTLELRKPAPAGTKRGEAIRLPRPKPPEPPSA